MYRLMIIDDEVRIVEGLQHLLDWEALRIGRIETATDYAEAAQKAIDFMPDIALVDICIRDRKGYELIEEISAFSPDTRYIMISGYDDFKYVKQAMRCGARDYLLKPIDSEELKTTIRRVIVEDLGGKPFDLSEHTDDPVLTKDYAEYSKLTQKIVMLVRQDYASNINLKVIAERFAMNSTYLGQLFQKDTGMKFSDYLLHFRLCMARRMVTGTDEKIANIATAVGFPNTNYFYTQFQTYFGASPLDFRKGNREVKEDE